MPEMIKTIEIDCPPMTPRPDSYIESVIAGTGLPSREPVGKFFGNWTWDYSDVPDAQYLAIQPTLKERLTKLYESGACRYCSW